MTVYTLHREQFLPVPIEQAWDFFSAAKNLNEITPKEMKFEILTDLGDGPIYTGMRIDYKIRPILSFPLRWTTEIVEVCAPFTFVDTQIRGPYELWRHTHTFARVQGGVVMNDEVQYALPLGIVGQLVHSIVVKEKLKRIFDFRAAKLKELFGA